MKRLILLTTLLLFCTGCYSIPAALYDSGVHLKKGHHSTSSSYDSTFIPMLEALKVKPLPSGLNWLASLLNVISLPLPE